MRNVTRPNDRFPALDGLRGIAILLVLFRHFFEQLHPVGLTGRIVSALTSAGWCGVDLFFVLSGFLITRNLLLREGTVRERLAIFWSRRFRRIFPVYYAFLALWSLRAALRGRAIAPWPYWAYVANWWQPFHMEWLAGPLTPFWSLAVEEQFYLAWPLVVVLGGRRWAVKVAAWGVPAAIGVRLSLLCLARWQTDSAAAHLAYTGTFSRMDALFVGALAAFAVVHGGTVLLAWISARYRIASLAGCAVLLVAATQRGLRLRPPVTLFGFTALAILFGCIVLMAVEGDALPGLTMKWLRSLGTISYGVYVFHYPICQAVWHYTDRLQTGRSDAARIAIVGGLGLAGALVSIGAAWLSFHYFESRFVTPQPRTPTGFQGQPSAQA
jgi:peptidoglycan/LPS O-acetylase OafA/YrhL